MVGPSLFGGFEPIRLLDVDIADGVPAVPACSEAGRRYPRARSIVRLHGRPLGVVQLAVGNEGLTAEEHAAELWRSLGYEIRDHLSRDGLLSEGALSPQELDSDTVPRCLEKRNAARSCAPFASVVVATRDRPESVGRCLTSLLELDYPAFEVVVVDNAPATGSTRRLVSERFAEHASVKYVREDRPGLASAHNRGLSESMGSIVAFADDDTIVDRLWLLEVVACFLQAEDVGCVTGLILPAELETPAQVWAEDHWGLGKGFVERRFNLDQHRPQSPLFPYTAGVFGSGANMAFRTDVLRDIGEFDPAIGAGTPARGGDDLAAFFRLVAAGHTLVYSPAAIVRHRHARDYQSLRRQAYGYGVGLAAYLTKIAIDEPARLPAMSVRAPRGVAHALRERSPNSGSRAHDYPPELKRIERKGMLHGPLAYLRSRRQARRWNGLQHV